MEDGGWDAAKVIELVQLELTEFIGFAGVAVVGTVVTADNEASEKEQQPHLLSRRSTSRGRWPAPRHPLE